MRIHLIALPHTQPNEQYLTCAYTQKVVKFCDMMSGLHHIILYAGEKAEGLKGVTEHVSCMKEEDRAHWFPGGFDTVRTPFEWTWDAPYWKHFGENAIREITQRAEQGDLVLLTSGGNTQKPIADAVADRTKAVEWAVGYEGICTDFCAFESYCWQHHVYGLRGWRNGRAFDAVVPNFFDRNDFLEPKDIKGEPYLLYLARVTARKGPHIAGQIAKRLGMKLKVAGPGAFQAGPGGKIYGDGCMVDTPDVEYLGEVGREDRAKLIQGAACMLCPTLYVEPFGGAGVEAMMGGCPVVASDWGAFTETVQPGLTGYRFRTLQQGCDAVEKAMKMDRRLVSQMAESKYSLDAVRPKFEAWFEQIQTLWGAGWYA